MALALSACAYGSKIAAPGEGNSGTARFFENRVWIDTGPDAPGGSLRAFLSDGTLFMTSCVEPYQLAPWRWVDSGTLVWEEGGRNIRGEVVFVARDTMAMVIDSQGLSQSRTFRAAAPPHTCREIAKSW